MLKSRLRLLASAATVFIAMLTHMAAIPLRAATNDLTSLLQRGLFEEEANRNFDAAITSYESVAKQFDKDRQIAATAVFRLGECYRKLGKTNEATLQYQRVVRDFSDQPTLVTLSRQNLAGMGAQSVANVPPATDKLEASAAIEDEEDKEIRRIQAMIQNSPDLINSGGSSGTPLGKAASAGWLRVATYLLDHGADANLKSAGAPPIVCAALSGNKGMAELLLDRGADVNAADGGGRTALHTAALSGFLSVAEVLLRHKADVNARDSERNGGSTPLHLAAAAGLNEMIRLLIKNGADVNARSKSGSTPLFAAVRAHQTGAVASLLEAKADPNLATNDGLTPLALAPFFNEGKIVDQLLAAGANPNLGPLDPPLFGAIKNHNMNMVEQLLRAGADPNRSAELESRGMDASAPSKGQPPAGQTLQTFTNSPLQFSLSQPEMVGLLLKFKANPNGTEESGLLVFQALPYPESLRALLDAGANPNVVKTNQNGIGIEGETPLIQASKIKLRPSPNGPGYISFGGSDFEAAQLLITHGADVNVHSPSLGLTPLHFAVANGSLKTIDFLLKNGAEVNTRDDVGRTPLDLAKQSLLPRTLPILNTTERETFEQIAALLRQHGALDDLPDFSEIRLTRQGLTQPLTVFRQNTNGWNQFALMETLLRFYAESRPKMIGGLGPRPQLDPNSLAFPDLTRIIIHRSSRTDESKTQDISVNLLNATNGIDCSKDVRLEFGDVVEIPIREYRLQENPVGLTPDQSHQMADCLKRQVTVNVRNETRTISPYAANAFLSQVVQLPEVQSLLLSSSDLAHIRVKRQAGENGRAHEFILNVSQGATPAQDLWLRDGDAIEIPEK